METRSPDAAGLARSLQMKQQRAFLDSIGAKLGVTVVYLKGAWADPVLYGGRGERFSNDVDILVDPRARWTFARELEAHGYASMPALGHHIQRGWHFRRQNTIVDLHLNIAEQPWFPIDVAGLLKRAHAWESVDGPVIGLSADDQVVHAAAHYAADRYLLDDRHMSDVERLLETRDVNWSAIEDTCARGHMTIPLHVFGAMLRRRGNVVPDISLSVAEKARLTALRRVFNVGGRRRFYTASRDTNVRVDLLALFPLLSTRWSALPRLLASSVTERVRALTQR